MKQFFLVLAVSAAVATNAQAQVKAKTAVKPAAGSVKAAVDTTKKAKLPGTLKNSLDSFSYALGMNIANNLKQQNIDKVNTVAMAKAMNDVFKKKTAECSEQQANAIIQQTLQGNSAKKAGNEKAKGVAFLAANKKRKEVITLPNGLQYEVLKKGDPSSVSPTIQDTVVAHYAGTLIDGKKFDNSYDRGEPLTIPVGGVIQGWTQILQIMHIGDKFKVFIPSELGYGDRGAGADIPGGSTLIFEMELLEVKKAAPAQSAVPNEVVPVPAPVEEKKN